MHAREWIGVATSTYILNQLLTSTDASIKALAENYNFYVFPVANPDGYAYTHSTVRRQVAGHLGETGGDKAAD